MGDGRRGVNPGERTRRTERSARPRRRRPGRRWAIGLAVAAAGVAAGVAGQRAAARRFRARPDPEAGQALGTLPPEDLGRVASFDGTEIAVRAAGPPDAPALVFAHGVTLDMTTWYYQWRAFSDRFRCVLFDHRAHGRSGKPPGGDYSVRAMGRDLRAVLDHAVGDGPAVLVGHSMGGMAVVAMAEAHPEEFGQRVRGAVLADTGVSDLLREALGGLGPAAERVLRRIGTVVDVRRAESIRGAFRRYGSDLALLVAKATNFGPDASPSQVEHVTRISTDAPAEVWVDTLRELMEVDLRHALGHITVPTLIVVGDRDLITPKTSARALRDAIPSSRAVVITRAGHVSMMEQHRVFNEMLGGFLDEVLAGKPRARAASRT